MKKIFLVLFLSCFSLCVFSQTPSKPYWEKGNNQGKFSVNNNKLPFNPTLRNTNKLTNNTIPLEIKQDDQKKTMILYINATIDNNDYKFLLDTGSNANWLNYSALCRLGLNPGVQEKPFKVIIKDLSINNNNFYNVIFYSVVSNMDFDGIIGLDFFWKMKNFSIDAKSKSLILNDNLPAQGCKGEISKDSHFIIKDVEVDGKKCVGLIDTGDMLPIINNNLLKMKTEENSKNELILSSFYTDIDQKTPYRIINEIKIGNEIFKDTTCYLFDKDTWKKTTPPIFKQLGIVVDPYTILTSHKLSFDLKHKEYWIQKN